MELCVLLEVEGKREMCAGTLQRNPAIGTRTRNTFAVMCCLLQIYIRKLYFVLTDLVFFLATVLKTYGVLRTYAQYPLGTALFTVWRVTIPVRVL